MRSTDSGPFKDKRFLRPDFGEIHLARLRSAAGSDQFKVRQGPDKLTSRSQVITCLHFELFDEVPRQHPKNNRGLQPAASASEMIGIRVPHCYMCLECSRRSIDHRMVHTEIL